jgi:hypothetical protein
MSSYIAGALVDSVATGRPGPIGAASRPAAAGVRAPARFDPSHWASAAPEARFALDGAAGAAVITKSAGTRCGNSLAGRDFG